MAFTTRSAQAQKLFVPVNHAGHPDPKQNGCFTIPVTINAAHINEFMKLDSLVTLRSEWDSRRGIWNNIQIPPSKYTKRFDGKFCRSLREYLTKSPSDRCYHRINNEIHDYSDNNIKFPAE